VTANLPLMFCLQPKLYILPSGDEAVKAHELQEKALESVRKHQAGLQSFRSIRRIEARRRNASALRLRFSQSLASLRQRLSQAMVRSTISAWAIPQIRWHDRSA